MEESEDGVRTKSIFVKVSILVGLILNAAI